MRVECRIEIEYGSEAQARNVASSISLDNGKYAQTEVVGKRLLITSSAPSAPSMLHTLEDLMACLKVADQVVKGRVEGSELDPLSDPDG
ncbi:MAG TPA: KEOPS complex subunit Pcc1 [Methanomassiliicoccales archaeon]|nr:KEOPS complex subunit Pcc1 [Methanomassiliicoccales archaeon]